MSSAKMGKFPILSELAIFLKERIKNLKEERHPLTTVHPLLQLLWNTHPYGSLQGYGYFLVIIPLNTTKAYS